jgi:hypothetical protein
MGGQPGKPSPPGNPPIRREPDRPPVEEPPRPIPVPPVQRPPAPMQVYRRPVLDLESRFRCCECDARGKAVVSVRWGDAA